MQPGARRARDRDPAPRPGAPGAARPRARRAIRGDRPGRGGGQPAPGAEPGAGEPARRARVSKWRRNMIVQAFASAIARASGLGVAAKLAAVTTVVTVAGVSS